MAQRNKSVVWLHGEVRTPPFARESRIETGFLLRKLQQGEPLGLPHSRPMPKIGQRCHELRIRDPGHSWRIFYRVDPDAVIVLEVLDKKTARTPWEAIERCRVRLRRYEQDGGQ